MNKAHSFNDSFSKSMSIRYWTIFFLNLIVMGEARDLLPVFQPLVLLLSLVGIAWPRCLKTPLYWLLLTLLLVTVIAQRYFLAANHIFLIGYLCLNFLVVSLNRADDQDVLLERSLKYIFILAFVAAGLQKLLSPTFVNGSFLGFTCLIGPAMVRDFGLFNFDIFMPNLVQMFNVLNADPATSYSAELFPPSVQFLNFCILASALTVFYEFVLALLFIVDELVRIKHIALQFFALFVALVFTECIFAGLVCVLGYSQLPAGARGLRFSYIAVMLLLAGMEIYPQWH
jgi:hypothetical protein